MQKRADVDYYGFHDEDDGKLLEAEMQREIEIMKENPEMHSQENVEEYIRERYKNLQREPKFHAVNVPNQQEIHDLLLDDKKSEILHEFESNFDVE